MTGPSTQCEHATSTTVLWLYGEADDSHATHVAGCADCTSVADDHATVAAAMPFEVMAGLHQPAAHADGWEPERLPAPANRSWIVGTLLGLAAAAVVLLGLSFAFGQPTGLESEGPAPQIAEVPELVDPASEVASNDDLFVLEPMLALDEDFDAGYDDFDSLYDDFAAFEEDLATL
ncbi:MAG: hypothetical protein AB8H79_10885 [Myxococcota bacterium]